MQSCPVFASYTGQHYIVFFFKFNLASPVRRTKLSVILFRVDTYGC